MPPAVDVNAQTALDMSQARAKTSIDVKTVRDLLFAGRSNWEIHQKLENILSKEPLFSKLNIPFVGRVDAYRRGLAITNRLIQLQRLHGWTTEEMAQVSLILLEWLPINLHNIAFEPVFISQASPVIMDEYWDLVTNKGIQGCYLQTELGHGSNVARLETTATYLPETQEFEIHSPSLTSTKWWVGGLGKTATHGIVQAKLVLPVGKDMGPHLFLVQLRSLEDHSALPGIVLGDIGPKAGGGLPAIDNGYARFDHVRIPRVNMFSKFARVTKDGRYVTPSNPRHSYAGMMYIRASMVTSAGWTLARGITIAIRYSTVRRQGYVDADGLECQVLLYPSTYHRLLPILSRAYVFIDLGRRTTNVFSATTERIQHDSDYLAEVHATLCGLKVLASTTTAKDLETARRALGGHGYSAFAGIGRLYADYLPAVTYEGDNYVLDGQVVRAALKSYKSLFSNSNYSLGLHSYLRLLQVDDPARPQINATIWQHSRSIIRILEWRAALAVKNYAQAADELDGGINHRLSKAITESFVAARVGDMISALDKLPQEEARVLGELYHLYLLTTAEDALVDLLSMGLLRHSGGDEDVARDLRLAVKSTCVRLLPNAIGLTDAFSFSDWSLDSALGVYDGRVYEELWRRAQFEPLNQLGGTPGYEESLKPMLQEGRAIVSQLKSRL
ncbi:peroxisomal oxidase [Phlebopus sp. FC_14]|nr:peroxisomal oxidase [Phlebopus sp. FC_14]